MPLWTKSGSALCTAEEKPENLVGKTEKTKLTYHTTLIGRDGKAVSAKVVVVIQKDNGRKTYKIVTVYPDKKEGKK